HQRGRRPGQTVARGFFFPPRRRLPPRALSYSVIAKKWGRGRWELSSSCWKGVALPPFYAAVRAASHCLRIDIWRRYMKGLNRYLVAEGRRTMLYRTCRFHRPPSLFVDIIDRKSTRLNSSHVKISY